MDWVIAICALVGLVSLFAGMLIGIRIYKPRIDWYGDRITELEAKVTGEKTVLWTYHPGMSDEEKSEMIKEMRMAMKCSGKFSPRAPLY